MRGKAFGLIGRAEWHSVVTLNESDGVTASATTGSGLVAVDGNSAAWLAAIQGESSSGIVEGSAVVVFVWRLGSQMP